ncbi:hypothetical protein AB0J52_14430, partial [Spirillospora sp. NPDC049652]
VRRQDDTSAPETAEERQARENLTVPRSVADPLSALNAAQQDHDRALRRVAGLRERLFADWCRYMLCAYPYEASRDAYPDADEARFFLERELTALTLAVERTEGASGSTARALADARTALDAALKAFNAGSPAAARSTFTVQQIAAPQFYEPAEPVVLLTGPIATPSNRYGEDGADKPDGLVPCHLLTGDAALGTREGVTALRSRAAKIFAGLAAADAWPAVRVWKNQPWHPVLLQWEAEFFPVGTGGNLDTGRRDYAPDYVTANYELPATGVELRSRTGREATRKAANIYTGTTILSPNARPVLSARVLTYLAGTVLPAYNATAGTAVTAEQFQRDPTAVLDGYRAKGTDPRLKTLIRMYRALVAEEDSNLSQALSGFNDGLLMRRAVRQLPVSDPVGFPDYRDFTARVAAALGEEARSAPQPLADFNPIRAGALRVRRVRVVDSFGLSRDVDTADISTTARLRVPGHPDWAALSPRLTQPARVALRWLDAAHDLRESTVLPVSSPVCGWLVPDHLTGGLDVYAQDGASLGRLSTLPDATGAARWTPAPGGTVLTPDLIANAHLRATVARIRGAGPDELATLLGTFEDILKKIEPADTTARRGQAVLMGRPLAVVRAAVNLELAGLPAVHQDWNVFRQDLRRTARETNGFTMVDFPVRIGALARLNDGVVGFWREDSAGTLADRFDPAGTTLKLALDKPAALLTLLIDPHGHVHATSGILPTKSISLPPEHYAAALAGMEVDFRVAPLLGDLNGPVAVPVPEEAGYRWSWRQRGRTGWLPDREPALPRPDAGFPAAPTVREGWLALRTAPEEGSA